MPDCFVPFDYSADASPEMETFFKHRHKIIVALAVQEIRDEHIVRKLARFVLLRLVAEKRFPVDGVMAMLGFVSFYGPIKTR
jgi:hypothetical protein